MTTKAILNFLKVLASTFSSSKSSRITSLLLEILFNCNLVLQKKFRRKCRSIIEIIIKKVNLEDLKFLIPKDCSKLFFYIFKKMKKKKLKKGLIVKKQENQCVFVKTSRNYLKNR